MHQPTKISKRTLFGIISKSPQIIMLGLAITMTNQKENDMSLIRDAGNEKQVILLSYEYIAI